MISKSVTDNLTQEEFALLVLILNDYGTKRELFLQWEPEVINSFNLDKARAKVLAAKDCIKEENMSVWESLTNKLS